MDADALSQINEARTGHFGDWWAPVLDWLWRPLFLVHASPGFVLLASTTITVFSVYELLRAALRTWPAVFITILIAAFPPVFAFLASLQRDTWFGASTLAAYALLVRAYRKPPARRPGLALLSLLPAWFAIAARQNGFIAVLPGTIIAMWILLTAWQARRRSRHAARKVRSRTSVILLSVGLGISVILGFAGSQWFLDYHVIHARHMYSQQEMFETELAQLSLRTGKVLLPPFLFPAQNLAVLRAHSSPYDSLPLVAGPDHPLVSAPGTAIPSLVNSSEEKILQHDWVDAVIHHPVDYLRDRWKIWTRFIAWSGNSYEPFHAGIDPNKWNYHASLPSLDKASLSYLGFFTTSYIQGGLLNRTWVYMILVGIIGLDMVRRRRTTPVRIVGCLCLSTLVYYFGYLFLGDGLGFRFGWVLVTSTVVGMCVDLADRLGRWRLDAVKQNAGALLEAADRTSLP